MVKLFEESDVTNDQDTTDDVVRIISEWAAAIPHHSFKDLGKLINIRSIEKMPCYPFEIQTQYENRQKSMGLRPYAGESIPPFEIKDINEVDVWNIALPDWEEFNTGESTFEVQGSQQVVSCSRCDGRRTIVCQKCNGKGVKKCPRCKGSGDQTCSKCNGSQSIRRKCGTCGGSGKGFAMQDSNNKVIGYQNCNICDGSGTGTNPCNHCDRHGKETCDKCNGRGKINCPTCQKSGQITCPSCGGTGSQLRHIIIQRNYDIKYHSFCGQHAKVSATFPDLPVTGQSSDGEVAADITEETISPNTIEGYEAMRVGLATLQDHVGKHVTNECHVAMQNLIVQQVPLMLVEYEYEDEIYNLAIYGGKDQVYSPNSPISKARVGIKEEAQTLLEQEDYVGALRRIKTAIEMDPNGDDKELYDFQYEVEDIIRKPISWGSFVGSILSSAMIWFLSPMFFSDTKLIFLDYAKSMFVSNPDLFTLHPIVMAVPMIILNLLSGFVFADEATMDVTKGWVGSGFIRFLIAIPVYLFQTFFAVLIVMILNALGVITLLTWFVDAILGFF